MAAFRSAPAGDHAVRTLYPDPVMRRR